MDPRASSDEPGSSETSARQAAPAALDTRVTRLLSIRHPVIQGGMAWVADAHLAAAVSNAGGLGVIACGGASPAWVRSQILQARALTDAPFGVNIMLLSPHVAELAQMVIDLQVPVVTTGAGSPSAHLESWKEAGVKVLPNMVVNHDDSPMGVSAENHDGVYFRSVYFTDPNGIMMELAATTKVFGPEDVRHTPARAVEPAEA